MLRIAEVVPGEAGRAQRTVLITVEGDSVDEASSFAAKNLAYGERAKHEMPEAGIEYVGGAFPVSGPAKDEAGKSKLKYHRTFKLTQAL
jgi:hypothetical protein